MTEQRKYLVKILVVMPVLMTLLDIIRERHLNLHSQVLYDALTIFAASSALYWLPPKQNPRLPPWYWWLVISLAWSLGGAFLLAKRA